MIIKQVSHNDIYLTSNKLYVCIQKINNVFVPCVRYNSKTDGEIHFFVDDENFTWKKTGNREIELEFDSGAGIVKDTFICFDQRQCQDLDCLFLMCWLWYQNKKKAKQ